MMVIAIIFSINTPQFHFHVLLKENLFFTAEISKYCIILIWYKLPTFHNNLKLHRLLLLHWHYSPLWSLACRKMSFHFILSATKSSHSQHMKISFYFLFPSFPGSSPSSRLFQFLSEELSGHPILLHSLQVTYPPYPLPFHPFYYIFSFAHLF